MIEQQAAIDTAEETSLIVVPGNVDVDFDLDVKHGVYADLTLNKLSGCLIVHDRCLQLNNLEAVTDAGTMELTALYATRSKKDITTGFDLEMQNIQVARLIKLVPSVDTLLPMLRSFEGDSRIGYSHEHYDADTECCLSYSWSGYGIARWRDLYRDFENVAF